MYFVYCSKCNQALRVTSTSPTDEVDNLERLECHSCGALALTSDELPEGNWILTSVTPAEAYTALSGLGLPSEQECGPLAVEKLFNEQRVTRVASRLIRNTHRCIIDFIEFEDGTKMYLGSSTLGATVYRIAPKHSYAEQVEAEHG